MKYRESEEMYLETILLLKGKQPEVRAVDVAAELGYAKSSVSRALKLLIQKKYIDIAGSGAIAFTEAGCKRAHDIYDRHLTITEILIEMGATRETAEKNACRIEHVISDEMFGVMKEHLKKKKKA